MPRKKTTDPDALAKEYDREYMKSHGILSCFIHGCKTPRWNKTCRHIDDFADGCVEASEAVCKAGKITIDIVADVAEAGASIAGATAGATLGAGFTWGTAPIISGTYLTLKDKINEVMNRPPRGGNGR